MPPVCADCGFEIFLPIAEGADTVLGLYDDDRFPGRCILAIRQHAEHFDDVDPGVATLFQEQALRVGRALRNLGLGNRINYAVLGNANPHVHMHIIPRGGPNDANLHRPPWEHPRSAKKLPTSQRDEILSRIRAELPSL